MKLQCLIDHCPQTGKPVDMRRCCGVPLQRRLVCPHYDRDPWSEFASVSCNHPKASRAAPEIAAANLAEFKAVAPGLGHLLYCT